MYLPTNSLDEKMEGHVVSIHNPIHQKATDIVLGGKKARRTVSRQLKAIICWHGGYIMNRELL